MPVIYLIRHGKASFGEANYDVLSQTGWQQSRLLGKALALQPWDQPQVRCGTMRRHRETAQAVLAELNLPEQWLTDTGFNEYDHQQLLAQHWPLARDQQALNQWLARQTEPRKAFQARFEGALRRWQRGDGDYHESWPAFRQRVLASLNNLAEGLRSEDSALVFTSGGAISVIIQHLMGLSDEALITYNRNLINTSVTRLQARPDGPSLISINEHLHLPGEQVAYR